MKFILRRGITEIFVKEINSLDEVFAYLDSIGEHREPYYRFWIEDETDMVIDYGSWSQYAVICFDSEEEALTFINSLYEGKDNSTC